MAAGSTTVPPPYLGSSQPASLASVASPAAGSLAAWQGPCQSPLTVWGLFYGTWTFAVKGTDAAGNSASSTPLVWKQAYTSGVTYTRLASVPPTLTNNKTLTFKLYAFTVRSLWFRFLTAERPHSQTPFPQLTDSLSVCTAQGSGGSAQPTLLDASTMTFQYQLSSGSSSAPWLPVPASPTVVTSASAGDGSYTFAARAVVGGVPVAAADAAASATVRVLTTPPTLSVVSAPPAVQPDPAITVQWRSSNAATPVAFSCRWLYGASSSPLPTTPSVGASAYGPCNGLTATSSTAGTQDGYWLFQVR